MPDTTPTPWPEPTRLELDAGDLWQIGKIATFDREADARLAVRAVNAHDALLEATREAVIAWSVCASIHREYGKKRDALFTKRQEDYEAHENKWRERLAALRLAHGEGA